MSFWGAKVITGGCRLRDFGNGHYYAPTVLCEANTRMALFSEETFGPVVRGQQEWQQEDDRREAGQLESETVSP